MDDNLDEDLEEDVDLEEDLEEEDQDNDNPQSETEWGEDQEEIEISARRSRRFTDNRSAFVLEVRHWFPFLFLHKDCRRLHVGC